MKEENIGYTGTFIEVYKFIKECNQKTPNAMSWNIILIPYESRLKDY